MPEHPDEQSPDAQRRVQPFLDCVARLLARRWLRDQRQEEEKPAPNVQEAHTDQPES
jgi:hypothetical protein